MKTFISIFINDIKLILNDWKVLFIIMATPVVILLYFSYGLHGSSDKNISIEPFPIALVDNENSLESRMLGNQLDEISLISKVYRVESQVAENLLNENKIAASIIIPEGFTQSVNSGENKSITVTANSKMMSQANIVNSIISNASNIVSSGQAVLYSYYHFVGKTNISKEELDKEFNELSQTVILKSLGRKDVIASVNTYPNSNVTSTEYYTSSLLTIFLMFAGLPMLKMLVSEKSLGITQRLASTNVGTAKILLSKLASSLLLFTLQFTLIIILTSTIIKNYWGAPVLTVLALFFSCVWSVSCWAIFVSVISNSMRDAEVIGNLGILFMALIGGSIYPLSKLPQFLEPISLLTINRHVQKGFLELFSGSKNPNILPEVLSLIAIGVCLIVLSIIVHKSKIGGRK